MDISHSMVHVQQVQVSRVNRKNRDAKRARSYDGGISKGKFEFQEMPKFNKRFSNKFLLNFLCL